MICILLPDETILFKSILANHFCIMGCDYSLTMDTIHLFVFPYIGYFVVDSAYSCRLSFSCSNEQMASKSCAQKETETIYIPIHRCHSFHLIYISFEFSTNEMGRNSRLFSELRSFGKSHHSSDRFLICYSQCIDYQLRILRAAFFIRTHKS